MKSTTSWRRSVDALVVGLAILLAGFTAAYVARNSDQWLHFAAGRDLLNGKYSLGVDPYSHLAADRIWVNHAWLYDVGVFGLYSLDESGQVVVFVKAAIVALAFAAGLLLRRTGQPLWPWWLILLGAIAAAPHTGLRPMVLSALCSAIAICILFGRGWRRGSWTNPLLLALLTAVWANVDAWFLLGPALIGVVLIAEVVQKILLKPEAMAADIATNTDLVKALILSVLASLANPHHIRIWQMPVELGIGVPAGLRDDPQLATLWLSPLSAAYRDSTGFGRNLNGAAFALLFIAGGTSLALGLARVRLSYLFAWVLFALLALVHHRLILLFAVASVPLVAAPLAAHAADRNITSNLSAMLGTLARALAVPVALILLACAWPGWLQPKPSDPALANRVALGVEPDAALARTAKILEQWRVSGKLPQTVRGVVLAPDLANHIAWFAPHETVAVNSRYRHHYPDMAAWRATRMAFNAEPSPEVNASLNDLRAGYVAMSMAAGGNLLEHVQKSVEWSHIEGLTLWHFDGRTAVIGRRDAAAVRFDPVAIAFAANQTPLPEPVVVPPAPPSTEPLDEFVIVAKPVPLEAYDAVAYQIYANYLWKVAEVRHVQSYASAVFALTGSAGPALLSRPMVPAANPPDDAIALNVMSQRAARLATIANPDHPLAYYSLAQCSLPEETPLPGFSDADLALLRATCWRRFLARVPGPGTIGPSPETPYVVPASDRLARYYAENRMADFAHATRKLSLEYQKRLAPQILRDKTPEEISNAMAGVDKEISRLNNAFAERLEAFHTLDSRPIAERINAAIQPELGLPGEALKLITAADTDKEFGPNARLLELLAVRIRLQAGQLEEAVAAMASLRDKLKVVSADPQVANLNNTVSQQLVGTLSQAQWLAGDYGNVGRQMDAGYSPPTALTLVQKAMIDQAIRSPESFGLRASGQLHASLGGGLILIDRAQQDGFVLQNWLAESTHHYRRAQAYLLEGRMPEARAAFERSLTPMGMPLPGFIHNKGQAERYIRLIDQAK